jgi:hypothetical protein
VQLIKTSTAQQRHFVTQFFHLLIIIDFCNSVLSSAFLLHSNRCYRNNLFFDIMDSSDHVLASPRSSLSWGCTTPSYGRTRGLASIRTHAIVCQTRGGCCASFPSRLARDGYFTGQDEKDIGRMFCVVYLGKKLLYSCSLKLNR